MPEIKIVSKGVEYPCLIDQEDQELLSQFSWSLHSEGYAQTIIGRRTVLMHRLVMGVLDNPSVEVDHKFHNRLDNRKSQLRICSHSENRRNSRKLSPATSSFKGVYFESERGLYHAQIGLGDKVKNLGRYHNEKMAGKAYDKKALEVFKEYAHLNFKSSREARQMAFSWI